MTSDTLRSHGGHILDQLRSRQGSPVDSAALARFLTHIDRMGPKALAFDPLLNSERKSFRVGITGPPGAGKSTLIGALIRELRKRQRSISVLAVDPSSPFSGGAILGDRIRFNDFLDDNNVFVRSIGSRGSLGGLCGSAYLMTRAFDMAGFDISLVETVGVGQTELEIMNVADLVIVVLVPESGDSIQTMKAGLIEIADLFVVNKSDRDGAETLARELENSIELGDSDKHFPVLRVIAKEGKGVPLLADNIENAMTNSDWKQNRLKP
ncbi:MAG: methylmalonyl Co-A mutase-associated GTPase MeaB, partial [Bdellovibrionales bacterium]|nr:methylmalonyl Co-A mutase-associated GTPase MeaB [Bdellovibrionales bacterium]